MKRLLLEQGGRRACTRGCLVNDPGDFVYGRDNEDFRRGQCKEAVLIFLMNECLRFRDVFEETIVNHSKCDASPQKTQKLEP